MADVLEEVSALRKAAEQAREKLIRLEAQKDQAQAAYDSAVAELKDLGCETPEAALAEANSVRDSITELTAIIKTKLQEAAG